MNERHELWILIALIISYIVIFAVSFAAGWMIMDFFRTYLEAGS